MEDRETKPTHTSGTGKGEETAGDDEAGRYDTGVNPAGRETGGSTGRDVSSVDPQDPIDPDSPHIIPS